MLNLRNKLFFLFAVLTLAGNSSSQSTKLDSLKKLSTNTSDTHQVRIWNEIALQSMESQPTEGIKYADMAIAQSKKLHYVYGLNYGKNIKGICYDVLGKYDSALYYYQQALDIPLKGNEKFVGGVYSNIGLIYWNTDDYVRALQAFNRAIHILEPTNNYAFKSNAYNNMGLIYHDIKDYPQSNAYFTKAIQLGLAQKDTISILVTVINLAINYFDAKQYNEGKKILDKYEKYFPQLDEYGQSEYYLTKAALEINTQITTQTENYLQKALAIKEKIGHTLGVASVYISLSDFYQKKKEYIKSNQACYHALKYTEELKSLKKLQQVYQTLFINYLELNQKDSTQKYSTLYNQTTEAIFSEARAKAFSKEQIAFKTFEKEKENLALTIENNKIQARNKLIIFSSVALLAIAGLVLAGLWYYKKEKTLKEHREIIQQAVAETELMERERIARDLHDGVGQKLSVVKMQLSLKDTNIPATSKLLDDAIQDVREVSHNLLPHDLNKGLIPALEAMSQQINSASHTFKINLEINPKVRQLYIDKQHTILIYRMMQELIQNAIKYSEAKNININMDSENKMLKLILSDDGIGFDPKKLSHHSGIGIKNISERISQLIGSIQLTSDIGKGTQYNISIPL